MPVFEYVVVSHPGKEIETVLTGPTTCVARDAEHVKRIGLDWIIRHEDPLAHFDMADIEVLVRPFV